MKKETSSCLHLSCCFHTNLLGFGGRGWLHSGPDTEHVNYMIYQKVQSAMAKVKDQKEGSSHMGPGYVGAGGVMVDVTRRVMMMNSARQLYRQRLFQDQDMP